MAGFLGEAKAGGGKLVVAGALCLMLGISALPFYTLGVFVKPVSAEFGWERSTVQAGFTAMVGAMVVVGWLWGVGIDRLGARRVGIISQFGLAAGFLIVSFAPASALGWGLCWALLGALGAGTAPATWTRGVAAAFSDGRGTALGLTLMGTGFAGFLAPVLMTPIVAEHGWRVGYQVLAGAVLLVGVPVAFALYREPVRAAVKGVLSLPGMDVGAVLRGRRFWVMVLVFTAVTFGVGGIIPNLIPLLTDRGMTREEAALYASITGGMVIVGRVVAGMLFDRFWAPGVGAAFLALPAVSCLLLLGDSLPHGLATGIAAAFVGLAAGAEFDLAAFLIARYFGMKRYGTLYSLMGIALLLPAGIAPPVFGAMFDSTGSYDGVLLVCAGLFALAPLLLFTLGKYPRHD
ncbi:MFS transporter [Sandaracinobacteroides saxicola]|uniref:MFS transporter n=1 Tax=Sandaracinobacteroides saxicola TaxID=2759707 RepID=A0A7G5IGE5_9SPHN|nr:MFS transporter [Sandaracinobacteroides saxicola]QMW22437.1 MFS transporter [Sandaracinobacteroides saxicola]